MNVDVEIVLFVLGFLTGCALTFMIVIIAIRNNFKPDTKYIFVHPPKEQKPTKSDDWKTYEHYYESEVK